MVLAPGAGAQSTATLQGTVTDQTGAVVPGAKVAIRNSGTGEERTLQTDASGGYLAASLRPGTYSVEIQATGMAKMVANQVILGVGQTVVQNFTLKVAATTETVEITAQAPVIESGTTSVGAVIDRKTVQEIPLNGRHFVDLALLIPGSVTPPANGFLTAPLRGQGSFAFNSAGGREDSVNYMINGVNMSDPVQNQITFQPTINTVAEFKVDNSTYSAEYGRNSGSIVNIATRSGTNEWHGELYNFLRNNAMDARNFTNSKSTGTTTLTPNPQAPFKRNQFGADGGGPIKKDKTFFFLSYEGLRQRQSVPLSPVVLSDSDRAKALATGDAIIKKLLPFIPVANSGTNVFVSSAVANVNIDQGTVNLSHNFSDTNHFNFYYAFQHDLRGEPPTTQGNNLPGFGDHREGRRQILTLNDTKVFSSTLVNEARLGYNRIHITFVAENALNAADYGINSGVNTPIGLPQISVTGAFSFGGIGGFPQGRGDYSAVASDTLTWVHGRHTLKFGGEFRRIDNNNFGYTPGTFSFPSIAAFIADQATGFTSNPSNGANRVFVSSLGGFVKDSYKLKPNFLLELGLRYDWYGTPTEGGGRFVVFDPSNATLQKTSQPYNQSALNFQPRVGFSWDPFKSGKTVIRSAYAIMTDQPITGIVTALATNPPYAFPVSFAPTAGIPNVSFANAFTVAGGSVAPRSITKNYKDSYVQSWNFNVQQQLRGDLGMSVGYVGSKGTDLNLVGNLDQPINGVKPYPALSASSPIFPGKPLSTILVQQSVGNSSYNALWVTVTKRFAKGLQFDTSYTFSKSIDYNSRNNQGLTVQDSYNFRNDRGLSDFDARHRLVLNGIYDLPFKGNRLIEGWQVSTILQFQAGNPINFHTTNTQFIGTATLRPSVTGPVKVGFSPAPNLAATQVQYVQNQTVFVNQGNAFGNLGRNVIIGPGFENIDFSLVKNTKITERINWRLQLDAFDLLNHANFTNPFSTLSTLPSTTFGVITGGTRFTAGDFGTSRQIQLAMKLQF